MARASPAFRLIYSALRQCGARPGELCRATIADVDRANRVITLKEHKTARKTGQVRRIPIGRKLGELLNQAIGTRTEGPVFLSPAGKVRLRQAFPKPIQRNMMSPLFSADLPLVLRLCIALLPDFKTALPAPFSQLQER